MGETTAKGVCLYLLHGPPALLSFSTSSLSNRVYQFSTVLFIKSSSWHLRSTGSKGKVSFVLLSS